MLVTGSAVVYRLFDVGYAVNLERALDLLAASAPERVRPVRGEAQALQTRNTPITLVLGNEIVEVGRFRLEAEVSARIFEFGVVSLRARIPGPAALPWEDWLAFGRAVDGATAIAAMLEHHLRLVTERVRDAVERPQTASVREDYVVYRIDRLADDAGAPLPPDVLTEGHIAPLLLNEFRALSGDAHRELLSRRFSYYADDLTVVTWDNALVVEPTAGDTDVQFVLEFANAQLLELRYYDNLLDAELPRMYDRIAAARRGGLIARFRGRYAPLLADLQTLVADATDIVERVENSLKVTDDVYLGRIYTAAIEIFRGRAWRSGIDRKLGIIREAYTMLNAEAQAARAEALELMIVILIVTELVLAALT
jgi:hypothetical protein